MPRPVLNPRDHNLMQLLGLGQFNELMEAHVDDHDAFAAALIGWLVRTRVGAACKPNIDRTGQL